MADEGNVHTKVMAARKISTALHGSQAVWNSITCTLLLHCEASFHGIVKSVDKARGMLLLAGGGKKGDVCIHAYILKRPCTALYRCDTV